MTEKRAEEEEEEEEEEQEEWKKYREIRDSPKINTKIKRQKNIKGNEKQRGGKIDDREVKKFEGNTETV